MGHTDSLTIGDCGLPISKDLKRIDLALKYGVPSFLDTLDTVLEELCVEEIIIDEEIKEVANYMYKEILNRFKNVKVTMVKHDLATMTILRGVTLVFTDGKPITLGSNDLAMAFGKIGGGTLLGIPSSVIITILVFVACYYILNQTKMGRYTYALGGNEEATKLSGLNTDKIKIWVYTISGILSAIAGIIITSRLYSAQPTAGTGYELDAIAAVVLGGTKLTSI